MTTFYILSYVACVIFGLYLALGISLNCRTFAKGIPGRMLYGISFLIVIIFCFAFYLGVLGQHFFPGHMDIPNYPVNLFTTSMGAVVAAVASLALLIKGLCHPKYKLMRKPLVVNCTFASITFVLNTLFQILV